MNINHESVAARRLISNINQIEFWLTFDKTSTGMQFWLTFDIKYQPDRVLVDV